jgi:hypothetical protein
MKVEKFKSYEIGDTVTSVYGTKYRIKSEVYLYPATDVLCYDVVMLADENQGIQLSYSIRADIFPDPEIAFAQNLLEWLEK